jgi:hypothetical protein
MNTTPTHLSSICHRARLRLPHFYLLCSLICALLTSVTRAQVRSHDEPGTADHTYTVSLVEVRAMSRFTADRGVVRWSDGDGTSIWIRLNISEPRPSHMIEANPVLVLRSLKDSAGVDFAAMGRFRVDRPSVQSDAQVYQLPPVDVNRPRSGAISPLGILDIPYLPSSISEISGEVHLKEVVNDVSREFPLAADRLNEEIAPGLWLRINRPPDSYRAEISFSFDPARTSQPPLINTAEVQHGDHVDKVKFTRSTSPDGTVTSSAMVRADDRSVFYLHVVLAHQERILPFRFGPVQLRVAEIPHATAEAATLVVSTEHGPYELRLNSISGSDTRVLEGGSHELALPSMQCRIDLIRRDAQTVFSRLPRLRITRLTDADTHAIPFTMTPDVLCADCSSDFEPEKNPASQLQYRSMNSVLTVEKLPRRLGVLEGSVSFEEIAEAVTLDVDLMPTPQPRSIAQGVWIEIAPPVKSSPVPYGKVTLRFDTAADHLETPTFIAASVSTAQGKTFDLRVIPVDDFRGQVAELNHELVQYKADKLRLCIATRRVPITLPFEFHNVPVTGTR